MKNKIFLLWLLFTPGLSAQTSVITLGAGTSIEIQAGTDLCADSIGGSGIIFGAGTTCGEFVAVQQPHSDQLPQKFNLSQNYPNPFNPVTVIKYDLPAKSGAHTSCDYNVSLRMYDMLGREVATLVNERKTSGTYTVVWHASGLASGVYFYRLQARQITDGQAGENVMIKKLMLLK